MRKERDVIIIGAGPAGLMAAYCAAGNGLSVTVLEKEQRLLKKLLISGKGRCNLTNDTEGDEFLKNIIRGDKFMRSSFSRFASREIMEFFEDAGVPLKVERGNRVFPVSDRSQDIADALLRKVRERGVAIENEEVISLEVEGEGKKLITCKSGMQYVADYCAVATGGLSYPKTGSTGIGYRLAESLGHTVIEPKPALVPIVIEGDLCPRLEGLSLRNVELSAVRRDTGKRIWLERGEMLFTSFGISGPLVLTLSSFLSREDISLMDLHIDLKPALTEKELDDRILRDFQEIKNRDFRNSLGKLLPQKLIEPFVELTGIPGTEKVNAITKAQRRRIVELMKDIKLVPLRFRPVSEAIVTSGGVDLREIDPKTMESKLQKGVYFIGEVIAADGYTGGFNLSIAFSTGHAAGSSMKGQSQ